MDELLIVRRETQIAAPPATVFAFLTDPQKILSWMGAEAETRSIRAGSISSRTLADGPAAPLAGNSARSFRSIASPIASVGRGTTRRRLGRGWSRSTSSTGTAAHSYA